MSKSRYVTGLRAVEQLLVSSPDTLRRVFVEYRSQNPRVAAITAKLKAQGIELQSANRARLQQMSGEARHQGVVAEVRRDTLLDEAGLRSLVETALSGDGELLLLILDGIQDPHNLGACLRTADAAGVDAVIVPRHGSATLGPTVSKVAAGAAEQVPFAVVANIGRVLDWLGEYGVQRIGTSDKADSLLYEADMAGPVAIVMGQEEKGLSKRVMSRCDLLCRLPMAGSVSSLNVSVATAICLFEAVRQRGSDLADSPAAD